MAIVVALPRPMEDPFSGLNNEPVGSTQSAQYMIKIDSLMTSTVKSYTNYAVVQGWRFGIKNSLHGYMAGHAQPRQPTTMTPLEVLILYGEYIPELMNSVATQKTSKKVELILLATFNKDDIPLIKMQMECAYLEEINMSTEYYPFFLLRMRFMSLKMEYTKVNQDKLTAQGKKAFSVDISKNIAK